MPKRQDAEFDQTPCNCLALRQAARRVSQIYDRHLAATGLRGTQYSILSKLHRLGPTSIGALADTMVIERTALSRAIRPLAREKLVKIGPGPDNRTSSVALTAAGETRFKAAMLRWKEAQKEFEGAFGASDAAALRASLARVVNSM